MSGRRKGWTFCGTYLPKSTSKRRYLKGGETACYYRFIYKEKGDIQDCGNYRGIKLMPHTMKIYERVIEARIRYETNVSEEQFGFMPERGTTDAIFILRQVMEKYREKEKELHLVFIDLENMTVFHAKKSGDV